MTKARKGTTAEVVFDAPEAKSFHLRLPYHSATMNIPSGAPCIETQVPFPSGAGFRCTARYWPNWEQSGRIKISVVVTRTPHRHQKHKVLAAHIDLPAKTGLPAVPPQIITSRSWQELVPVPSDGDVEGGVSLLVYRNDVETYCVADDHFTAICTVAVSSASWPPPPLPLPTPATLGCDIVSTAPDLMDVSFEVEGETFGAHRLVLAARSPVFKAELFGEMAESRASSITIEDMRAPTFKYMLDYMYHGLLPAGTAEMDDASRKMEFEHLYVAADRYGLDTLKAMCEEVLCATVSVSTVLSSLVFADDRTCPKLKYRCLAFLAVGENFTEVAVTNEYLDVMKDMPSLLTQVQNLFKRPRLS
ncbi:hypothetical protein HU200_039677 [Digitaria exilis]|uniref:BTB domain-containing protein n=1 Tax=Digitaria exilis TaxID=1010633 RepID=A0A835BBV0_9POAL|nr:hypothetical protein HU200_039677 [Digitaria exilis]CAB3456849.1 unnamed protein product [Digitaria exilis]